MVADVVIGVGLNGWMTAAQADAHQRRLICCCVAADAIAHGSHQPVIIRLMDMLALFEVHGFDAFAESFASLMRYPARMWLSGLWIRSCWCCCWSGP